MENQTDAELAALARGGDKHAFGQLVVRYFEMARRIAMGMVGNEEIAGELVQEALLEAYLSLDHLRDNARFKSWLYGIVLNVCRSYIRERKSDAFSLEALMGGMYRDVSAALDVVVDPQALVEQRELHRIVLDAISHLSFKERTTILLFYYEQLSLQEIAGMLGVSVVAVKGRLHRARKRLREQLLPMYPGIKPVTGREQRRELMVKVKIATVLQGNDEKSFTVVLLDEAGHRILNIWIGPAEAIAIGMGITEFSPPRPMTFHFMNSLLKATGIQLEEVRIEALKDDIFYAVAKFRNGNAVQELDTRPSDAMALAVLTGSPIYVAEEILERCGVALPEGKAAQLDKGRDAIVKKIEEVLQFPPKTGSKEEMLEQANQRVIAILTGE